MSGEAGPAVPSPRKCSGATLLHLERVLCLCLLSGLICQVGAQRPRKKENCVNRHDNNEQCELWARQGHCDTNTWMLNKCTRSCGLCYKDLDANERFRLILDEFYDYKSREFPEYATFVGYHNYDDSLESFKMEAFDRRKNETERFLKKLTDIDTEQLTRVNKREMKIIKSCLQTFIDGYKWREYGALNSVNFLEGLANGPQWPGYTKLETVQDFERYLKRLASMPDQIEEQIMLMKRAIKLKRSSHLVSINRVPDMMSSWNVDLYFLMPFQRSLSVVNFPDTTKLHMWDKAESLMPRVTQALNRMKQFMHHDYSDSTRESPGVHSLPHGLQYYEACLKWYLGYNATAAEVFDLGLKEVSRIMEKIKEVMRSVGFEGELKSFFRHIESIPQFYNHTKEEILHKYRSLLDDLIIPRLSTLFKNVTIAPIKVIPVERDGPWGSYGLGQFYVNLKEPEKRSTFTMMPLTLHEAYPGHHFQDLYSQLFEIPAYRAQPMNGRLYSVPFHFPVYTAYSEGWALYAEFLGHELDLYRDPYEL
ncbi:uncharacterized protein LOC131952693 [Physella acuta]|uniref:uncharacterized protein LOC131952693 n=1 Tax=Physella acuta TaxID=109671 RepID=UPI0027DC1347|nr:uncharacterized protein LOC131952693 [Physella acuta]